MSQPLRVVVVDDDPVLRDVLTVYLDGTDGLRVVRQFADTASLVDAVADARPDVIVLDNQMPGGDGVDVLPELRTRCPDARIVMFSADAWVDEVASARGADAFVLKGVPLERVVDAVLDVAP